MPEQMADDEATAQIEECLDEIDEFIGSLQRFSDPVIAESLRIHLAALLGAMVESNQCSSADVRDFAAALEHEALGTDSDEP
jgi:hypothetical protein